MIRTLVVDDSALMRKAAKDMLESADNIEVVGTARNGEEAIEKAGKLQPEVIVMDVNMPVMDGITAVEKIMHTNPIPTIMFSTLTKKGSREALEALRLGAIDFITKPTGLHEIDKIEDELVSKVNNIHNSKPNIIRLLNLKKFKGEIIKGNWDKTPDETAVLIGSSTGGPSSLEQIIPRLPENMPAPVFVVQHMPKGNFCNQLAARLDSLSQLQVKEARNNEKVENGVVYIAPGGFHMQVRKALGVIRIKIVEGEPVHAVIPAVDITAQSVTNVYGKNMVAAILTGMGNDGTYGFKLIHENEGKTIACSEDTCVIYGMPKAAIEAGAIDVVKPIFEIPEEIVRCIEG
ncbi:MAG: two-component system, chemotaxis family, response regulator CheB [Methanohalophilus sp. T328-1]|jgi:two-component system chemotaxis response regulator CheB|uniref:protein-glutamate methylesterase/protein-glutamine glutaminase n=1 Tax=Methanohalophilus sp. DAL1 TaxID=1864608 RepID=UPI00079B4FC6|nr:chemotaxis response regulator protein-glutamate methylesterase [Methanohalophilus sp. DAL1]KXS46375.1 MAG: two-component system, chemotaxis family, response regulator CheB [Methanohalophilus sp. T328-1]OBZ35477.1 MAG: chemotaxis response regulator protein-glutamate methylesterase [Methanohalophilus sp. DAL1]RSD35433.1 MAG: two-component system, chemotaxis family, response regulator CheB [Methanohalophilus sp.]